jgi:hypothetical protein
VRTSIQCASPRFENRSAQAFLIGVPHPAAVRIARLAGVPGEDLGHVANAATLERSVPEMAGNFI